MSDYRIHYALGLAIGALELISLTDKYDPTKLQGLITKIKSLVEKGTHTIADEYYCD